MPEGAVLLGLGVPIEVADLQLVDSNATIGMPARLKEESLKPLGVSPAGYCGFHPGWVSIGSRNLFASRTIRSRAQVFLFEPGVHVHLVADDQ